MRHLQHNQLQKLPEHSVRKTSFNQSSFNPSLPSHTLPAAHNLAHYYINNKYVSYKPGRNVGIETKADPTIIYFYK